MTTRAIATIDDPGRAAEAFPHRVLLAPPITRTIPLFSLQGEVGRPTNEVWYISQKDERAVIDKQALGRLKAGHSETTVSSPLGTGVGPGQLSTRPGWL